MSESVYCITTVKKWNHSKTEGEHVEDSLEAESFIHCSYAHQLLGVADRFFKGVDGLIILCIDPSLLKCSIVVEDLSGLGEVYPHIYGPINTDAVVAVYDLNEYLRGNPPKYMLGT